MQKNSVAPFFVRGFILIILGILIIFYDANSIKALGAVPGLIIAAIGVAQLLFAYVARKNLMHWQWYLAGGLAVTIIGVVLLLNPEVTLNLIVIAFGAWFLFQAFQDLAAAFSWKKIGHPNWWMLMLAGVFNAIIGLLFVFEPAKGAMVITTFIGLGMIFGGLIAILAGYFLRNKYGQKEA